MELDLALLLRLGWTAAIVPIVVASLPLPFVGFLHRLVMGFASRGKTIKGNTVSRFSLSLSYMHCTEHGCRLMLLNLLPKLETNSNTSIQQIIRSLLLLLSMVVIVAFILVIRPISFCYLSI